MRKKVVITGLGVISPIGIGCTDFWKALAGGKNGVGKIARFDASESPCKIDAEVQNFDPLNHLDRKQSRHLDRFGLFAVCAARMALNDAEIDLTKVELDRAGVIVGSGIGGLPSLEQQHSILMKDGPRKVSSRLLSMFVTNGAAGQIAVHTGFTGPVYSVSAACATANHAIGSALRHLRYGDADMILAGGSESAITASAIAGFCQAKAMTTNFNDEPNRASRPFDGKRSGFVMGEGAGVVVLETEEHAKRRGAKIYAELAGYAATNDAYHITSPGPEATAAAQAMRGALRDANMEFVEIDYINAHGTATTLNDKSETKAIKMVFGDRAKKIPVSATKSMTGHLLGASGGVELIATLLCMENKVVHPTVNYEQPDPDCDLDYVPNSARSAHINAALSNSFGFGGHNAVLAIKKHS